MLFVNKVTFFSLASWYANYELSNIYYSENKVSTLIWCFPSYYASYELSHIYFSEIITRSIPLF
jgi:hypothetical protein